MGMPTGPGSVDFNPHSLPLLVSILPLQSGEDRRRGKGQCWNRGCWMTHGEDEGTVFYRLHLLQNGASSLSSIPGLISSNNLPFSSCPNRESLSLRVWVCRREREREQKVTPSLAHQLSLSMSIGWWWSDKAGRGKQWTVCHSGSDRSILQTEHAQKPKSCIIFEVCKEERQENRLKQQWKVPKRFYHVFC